MELLDENRKRENINEAARLLEKLYPSAECALEYDGEPWKLLVMARLSAQCTDARVNIVSRELFARFDTPERLASADLDEIERIIMPCGLYRAKAKNIKEACALLTERYAGKLPCDMNELLRFPGVGRKIANLLIGDVFGRPSVVADTHCMRICGRLGMYEETLRDPVRVEKLLTPLIRPELSTDFCHRIVRFGRDICTARSPKCESCPLSHLCVSEAKTRKES